MIDFNEIINYVVLFVECLIALYAITNMLEKKYDSKKTFAVFVCYSVFYTVIITLFERNKYTQYFTVFVCIFLYFVAATIFAQGSFTLRFSSTITCALLMLAVDYALFYIIIMIICKNSESTLYAMYSLNNPQVKSIYLVADKIVQIILFFVLKKLFRKIHYLSNGQLKSLNILCISFSLIIRLLMYLTAAVSKYVLETVIFLSVFFIAVILIGTVVAVVMFFDYRNKKRHIEFMELSSMMMKKNYEKMLSSNEIIRQQVHDFKNHIMIINSLLKNDEAAKVYTQELLDQTYVHSGICHSGNETIDAIINYKAAEAFQNGIEFTYSVKLQPDFNMNSIDICALLANQIDNALDACKKIVDEKTEIRITIEQKDKIVFFKVENSTEVNPFLKNKFLSSTKNFNDGLHGYGIKIISETANKYNGSLKNSYENGEFTSAAMVILTD